MSDCLEYQVLVRGEYGRVGKELARKYGTEYAHRIVWIAMNGPIPDGLVVRHLCNNKACIRYEHLAIGTQKDNMQDWSRTVWWCPNGHMYTPDNTSLDSRGRKFCKECKRIRNDKKR